MQKGKPVNVLLWAIRVLRRLADADRAVREDHVTRELGVPPSTCFKILQTLDHAGVVGVDPASGASEPGVGLNAPAAGAIRCVSYCCVARERMEELAQRFQVAGTLWNEIKAALKDAAQEIGATLPASQFRGDGMGVPAATVSRNGVNAAVRPSRKGTPDGPLLQP